MYNPLQSNERIFVQGDLNSRTVFDDHESGGSQAKDVLLEARLGDGGCNQEAGNFPSFQPSNSEVLNDASLMAAIASDLRLPHGRWHEAAVQGCLKYAACAGARKLQEGVWRSVRVGSILEGPGLVQAFSGRR